MRVNYMSRVFWIVVSILILWIIFTLNIHKKYSISSFLFKNLVDNQTNFTSQNLLIQNLVDFKSYPNNLCELNVTNSEISFILFAYVMTRVDSFSKRNQIRNTWANKTLFPNLKLAFIIGKSNNNTINDLIKSESLKYNDLIQGDFIDVYKNLTYKSLVAWKWIMNYCSNAKLIIKIDDDLALNTNYLISYFNLYKNSTTNNNALKERSFYCSVCYNGSPHRNKQSKWYASPEEYNYELYGLKTYPTFCFGPAYIMTTDLIELLYKQAFKVKLFWLEDVFTGLLAKDIPYVNFNQISNRYIYYSKLKNEKDFFFIRDITDKNINNINQKLM